MDVLDNKYQIEQLLGQGGMGAVYRATHLGTKRTVAVKVIQPQLSAHDQFVTRFRREAEAAGRLRHPNVVDVTDFGVAQTADGPVAYLVMEYLDGCSLADIVAEEGALPIPWVIDILEQVCAAVETAHQAGIIHRDLKPDNIWLEPNGRGGYTVKVLDFGLVKLGETNHTASTTTALETETLLFGETSEDSATLIKSLPTHDENLTAVGSVMGTPFYMSPEQCRGEHLDTRSDIYSLGVVAYRLLTGETPFKGSPPEVIELHQTAAPPPVREKNRKVPRKMARIVMSALAKSPAERPQTATGFASALRASWEGPTHLLRHAFALYSEHFPTFFKIALLGYAPFTVLAALNLVSDKFMDPERMSYMQLMTLAVGFFLTMVVALLFAYFFVSAATVPVVVQLMIAPLRPIKMDSIVTALKRRWRIFAVTSVLVMTLILLGSVLLVIPGLIAAIVYGLYTPVVMMEQHGVRGTLRRSRMLSRRSLGTVLVITVLQFALPILIWKIAVTTNLTLHLNDDYSPKEFGFNFSMSGSSAFYQLLNVFITPLTAIMVSLLYLKTRKAGGESLRDASDQFEALDIPRSKWQVRMKSRLTNTHSPTTNR